MKTTEGNLIKPNIGFITVLHKIKVRNKKNIFELVFDEIKQYFSKKYVIIKNKKL